MVVVGGHTAFSSFSSDAAWSTHSILCGRRQQLPSPRSVKALCFAVAVPKVSTITCCQLVPEDSAAVFG